MSTSMIYTVLQVFWRSTRAGSGYIHCADSERSAQPTFDICKLL